ncbi:MAG: long-chain-fatty-acid--CoA ligase [Deltaproteobacteria bacterium]|nr:long-chain-fatty-acid--CoA ligase [Deltaproteobacteria bacterium]MBW2393529.1 long-chain-fatty-acid--CoA ligase [Deltaproteobacteria bacterium]
MRLHDNLDYHARQAPDSIFAEMGERQISYAEAQLEANRLANALIAEGLQIGDRVAILSKNSIEMAVFYFACSKAGVAPVPLNYRLAPPEWAYILNDSGSKLLVAQPELAAALEPVRQDLGEIKRFLSVNGKAEGCDELSDFVAGQPTTAPDRFVPLTADLYQMYTSGTTGRPKGAVLSQEAVCWQLYQAMVGFSISSGERGLIVAPMYHAAAGICTFAIVGGGGTLVIHEDFDPKAVVDALSDGGITVSLLVPAMIQFCLVAVPDVAERNYEKLRLLIYGASAIAEASLRQAMETFGCDFVQGYGMTETTAAVSYLMPEDHRRGLAGEPGLLLSAGRALIGTEIRIVDGEGKPVPNGTIGEVAARGPQLMRGYWNLEEATAEALRDGWMHTGDAGIMDDEGFVYIQDRVKDMIISGGENVYPREIEDVLYEHPAVAEAAVIGIPDEKWGETVKAVVVLKEGEEATSEELLAFCKGRLGGYKRPRSVDFIAALPRNPSGKVLKKDLREPYWAGHDRRVG